MFRKCFICGNDTRYTILKHISMCLQEGNPLPEEYNVVSCDACGFSYADVNASQREYDYYYSSFNNYSESNSVKSIGTLNPKEYDNANEHIHDKIDLDAKLYVDAYELIHDKIDLDAKILDVGCGSGDFLMYLREKNFVNLCGIDPSENSIRKLQEMGLEGIVGSYKDLEDEPKYDLVISRAVLEHIYDIEEYMLSLVKVMHKDKTSFLFCEVPAAEGFEENICEIPNYFNQEHINYFSIISLDNLMAKYGLFRVNENVYTYVKHGNNPGEKAILALYEKKDKKYTFSYDDLSAKSINNYFNKVQENLVIQGQNIRRLLDASKRVVIWGCGAYTMQLMKEYPELAEKVECFVDNNRTKWGNRLMGKSVYSPTYLESVENSAEIAIAICSMKNANDIQEEISRMALECKVFIL